MFKNKKKEVYERQDWTPHWGLSLAYKIWMVIFTTAKIVIGAVATADTLEGAIRHAYEVAEKVQFENKYCRKDIGARALAAK